MSEWSYFVLEVTVVILNQIAIEFRKPLGWLEYFSCEEVTRSQVTTVSSARKYAQTTLPSRHTPKRQ